MTDGPAAAWRAALLGGALALLPTDTVYGLAAALDSPAGVDALYRTKGRPRAQPCQVLVYAPGLLAEALAELPALLRAAAAALLPGPVTCLVPDPAGRYAAAAGDRPGGVGLRAPVVAGPLRELDIPLVATSANEPGGPDPARLGDVPAVLRAACAVRVDGGTLSPTPSAVVDLQPLVDGAPARLLRAGVDPERVRAALRSAGATLAD